MIRIIWTFAFFGAITSVVSNIVDFPFDLEWLFNVNGKSITKRSTEERSLCETNQCKTLATILTESMNETVDPCEDFYEYACGNWKLHNPLPKNEIRWNLLIKSQRNVEKRLLEILEQNSSRDSLPTIKLAKRAFKACMDTDELERRGLQPIVSTLWGIGGWPLIMEEDEWDEEIYKWQTVDSYYAHLTGLHSFYDVKVGYLDWDEEDISILIDTPHLPLNVYKLKDYEYDYTDSSDENNDSPEGSQEWGSEERRRRKEDEDDSEEGEDNREDDEDEEELQKRKTIKRKLNKRLDHNKRKNNKIKEIRKHIREENTQKRIKTSVVKTKEHNKKQHKQRKVTNHRAHHGTKMIKEKSLKREQMNLENYINDDLYFKDDDYENKVNIVIEKESRNSKEEIGDPYNDDEDGGGSYDYNDDDSGSYDYNDDDSGSGDYDDDGSGSGDYDDNNSGSGDYDNDGSGSGDYDDNEEDESEENTSNDEIEKERKKVREIRKKYAEYMLNVSLAIAEARGVPMSKEKLVKDINELIKFQLKLLRLTFNFEEEKRIKLRTFQKLYDALKSTTKKTKINWIKAVEDLFATAGVEIDANTIVGITSFDYIRDIRKLLDKTPSETIVNYIHWNFVNRIIKATTKEMRNLYYNWDNSGKLKKWNECINEIEAKYCLRYEYVQRHFSDDILQTASDMIDDIEKEVEYQIEESTWMNDRTRHSILDKLVYMRRMLGYPDTYRNATLVREHFRGLSVSQFHYENKLNIMKYIKRKNLRTLIVKKDITENFIDPLMVNAFFFPGENTIQITAADFQTHLFDSSQPWYTNFGIIGFIMAHEVNHAFDDSGRLFDKEGSYLRWLSAMTKAYKKRAKCFEDQYTEYSMIKNKTANIQIENYGKQTSDENIADTMGLQAVFRAYQRRQRQCTTPDPTLPGLQNFTNEQLFFLSYANLWCEVSDPAGLAKKMRQDPHSLGPLRVIGPVSNSEDFAKAYSCPEGSPMNPKKKCNIWK